MVAFLNPPTVHTPGGAYSHLAAVPSGTELVLLSGQVGIRPDGSLPESIDEQAEQVFANIAALLASQGLGVSSLVKLTMFIVAGKDIQAVRAAPAKCLGDSSSGINSGLRLSAHRPSVARRGGSHRCQGSGVSRSRRQARSGATSPGNASAVG